MGTRGYIIIKCKNNYYRIYNHFDSYPRMLGQLIIETVNTLKITEYLFDTSRPIINALLEALKDHYKGKNEYFYEEEYEPYDNSWDAEWFYTIDLNCKLLTVKGHDYNKTYNMLDIDKNWLDDYTD